MIDIFAILISCIALGLMVRRAIKLDSSLPWFEPLGGKADVPDVDAAAPRKLALREGILSASRGTSR